MHLSLMISVFFYMALNYGLVLFHFTPQNFFEPFLYGRYNGIKFLQILFTWECLKFSSILNIHFTGYRILGWFTDFFVQHVEYIGLLFPGFQSSDEKSAHNLVEISFYVIYYFFIAMFKLSLSLTFKGLIIVA